MTDKDINEIIKLARGAIQLFGNRCCISIIFNKNRATGLGGHGTGKVKTFPARRNAGWPGNPHRAWHGNANANIAVRVQARFHNNVLAGRDQKINSLMRVGMVDLQAGTAAFFPQQIHQHGIHLRTAELKADGKTAFRVQTIRPGGLPAFLSHRLPRQQKPGFFKFGNKV